MRNINKIEGELSSHQSRFFCFLVDTYSLPLPPHCQPERGALPGPPFSISSSVQRKWIWGSSVERGRGKRSGAREASSVFLCVAAIGEMTYIFLLWSIKITCYTSKGMSLSKGGSSCSLFNHLFTTCGSIVDENKAAFSSNSSPEFCLSQYSDSIIHPAPRAKVFTWHKDISFSIYKHGNTPFDDWIKNRQASVPEYQLF